MAIETFGDPPSEGLLAGSDSRKQAWTLDAVGDWHAFKEGNGTSWSLEQERENNKANEITAITDGDADSGETVIARYEYDGRNRRTKKHLNADTDSDFDTFQHFFYNSGWQILETRTSASENTGPETLYPDYQYVWSARYIDAPVLRDENKDSDDDCTERASSGDTVLNSADTLLLFNTSLSAPFPCSRHAQTPSASVGMPRGGRPPFRPKA